MKCMEIISRHKFRKNLLFFLCLTIGLYWFMALFYKTIPFNSFNYIYNAHHYNEDPRIHGGRFNLLRSLGQYDAQWYLKIADQGYPSHPSDTSMNDKNTMNGLTYAFFPMLPLIIALVNIFFQNVELSAFIVTNSFLLFDFFSLYYVVTKLYSERIANKTILLLFLFPFSIFYRAYFTEGIYVFFLIWFSYFLIRKKLLLSALCLGLLNITKGNGLLLNILFLYILVRNLKLRKIDWEKSGLKHQLANWFAMTSKKGRAEWKKILLPFIIVIAPFGLWMVFCYIQTGNPLYFYLVRSTWSVSNTPFLFIWHNLFLLLILPLLPLHLFHFSQIDVLTAIMVAVLLVKSKKLLSYELWWIVFILWANPLLVSDTMSFTRYQITSFPLFIYLATILHGVWYKIVLILFGIGLLIISLFFVNWYWIG